MDELVQGADVETGSPSVDSAPAPEAAVEVQPQPQKLPNFNSSPDWRRMVAERRQDRQLIEQLRQEIQASKAQPVPQGTPDEQRQLSDAAVALKKIFAADPEFKAWWEARNQIPQLMQGYQGVQKLTEAQSQSIARQGRQQIADLAGKAELPTDDDALNHMEEMVAGVIRRMDNGVERYRQGDTSVVQEAFKAIQDGFFTPLRRPAAASLQATKTKLRSLPPRPGGGIAGPEAPPKPVAGKEGEYWASLRGRTKEMLGELLKG